MSLATPAPASAIASRSFRFYLGAIVLGTLAIQMQNVAIAWQVFRLTKDEGAYAIVQALIARGVVGDFRAGDAQTAHILRFGFTPLYLGFEDVWNAVEHLRQVLESGEWQRPEFNRQHAVT